MSAADVADLLRKKVDGQGGLLLEPAMFPELASVLSAVGIDDKLQLSSAHVGDPPVVIVEGQGTLFGAKQATTVHLEVSGSDTLIATLTFTAPKGWGFKDGFPRLPGSYKHVNDNPGLVSLDTSILFDLPVATATVTAISGSRTLRFAGTLADAKRFSFLATALGMPAQPPLSGTLALDSGTPTADLVIGGGSSTLKIASLGFDQAGLHAYTVAQDPATGSALTRLDFVGTLEVGASDPVPIKLSAPFYEKAGVLSLSADFSGAGLTIGRGVTAFAELLGLDVGEFALPKPLDVLTSFGLKAMACVVSTDPPGLQQLAITVGPDKPWTITTGVEVRDLTVGWAVTYPFVTEARAMSASIAGTLALGTVDPRLEFDVHAAASEGFTASGALTQPMTLEQIVTTVSGSPVKGLPQLEVVTASISAASSGDFDLAVALANWKLATVGTTDIVLCEVSAALGRTSGNAHGRFRAVLGVGTARLFVSAEMGMSGDAAAGGWVFQGGTVGDSSVAVGDLLTELAGTFGIQDVPAPIASLSLTALNVTYKSATSEFSFTCTAKFTVDSTPVAVTVGVNVSPTSAKDKADKATVTGTKGYSAKFTGQVKFAGLRFDIVFDAGANDTNVLVADYVPDKADGKYTDVRSLVAEVSPSLSEAIPEGISVDLKEVKFVFLKQTESQWAFGLRLGSKIDLSELPIVGSKLPDPETLAIDNLQILYSSKELTKAQTDIINPVLPTGVAKLPETVGAGIGFDADVRLGAVQKHLHAGVTQPPALPATTGATTGSTLPAAQAKPKPPSSNDPVTWLDVNKQFGIFSFQRVGVAYQKNRLEFALDASVALGPIAFSMQALTVGSPLQTFDPEFSLKGLALSFDRPPITIGGAFLKVEEQLNGTPVDSYYGSLMVGVSQFSLKALGGWSPDANPASFFIYLNVDVPLGGPPFLFVTGLAGGFGINSSLTLPTIDKVGTYPLLPAKAPKEKAGAAETIAAVIPALQGTFHPKANQYWIAAGIQFTSFEMIKSQAVISVSFGVDLQIGVVGTCAMSFPSGDENPIAYVEIDVLASFTPSTGLLAVEGKLSPASYLLGGFVKLSGGFAFYAWFSGEHQGDFVVSLGGYHPAFKKPDNYPVVPRLQMEFSLGPLKVVGQCYFALTPGAFMAGLRLDATFEAGPIKAWFSAGFDMLIAWAPFHYEARAWVTIGCSVDLGLFTISVQIGAEVEIWGPAFGGVAVIDLDVVSFTIGFGAEKAPALPVGWSTFSESFLPGPEPAAPTPSRFAVAGGPTPKPAPITNVIKATVTSGQIDKGPKGTDWILDPDGFRILTASTVPANHAEWTTSADEKTHPELPNDVKKYGRAPAEPAAADAPAGMRLQLDRAAVTVSDAAVWETTLNIAPMDKQGVSSYHTISLRKLDGGYITEVTVTPQLSPSNTAMWGDKAGAGDPNAKRLIKSTLTGLAISPVPRHPDAVSNVPLLSLIFGKNVPGEFGYQQPEHDTAYTVSAEPGDGGHSLKIDVTGAHTASLPNTAFRLSALTDDWVSEQRDAIVAEFGQLGFATTSAAKVTDLAATALTDWPHAGRIGGTRS